VRRRVVQLSRPDDLALYVGFGCGYCEDVRIAARALGLDLEERDAWGDPRRAAELTVARGRSTVPVLRIRRDDGDEWMAESTHIIAYLRERYGDGEPPSRRWSRWTALRGATWAMWILLLVGGASPEPGPSALWTVACVVAAARSGALALRSGRISHWGVGAAFALGAVSISLRALGIADIPWWYVAFAVAALVALAAWARARIVRSERS